MAKKDRVKELRQKSKFAAMEGLRPTLGFPVPPRKAMSQAKKASKKLSYPLAPYPASNPLKLYRWANEEWRKLGRWQSLTLPFVILSALLTWEKEKASQADYYAELDRREMKREALELYGTRGHTRKKRKLLGVIPLPGKR